MPTHPTGRHGPILMKAPMVRATIAGLKHTTRRVIDFAKLCVVLHDTVQSEWPIFAAGIGLRAKRGVYAATMNPYGAVSVYLDKEKTKELGVKPGEFHFLCPYARGETTLAYRKSSKDGRIWQIAAEPDQRLWVKETYLQTFPEVKDSPIVYRADHADGSFAVRSGRGKVPWKSALFMPRAFSRIDLLVTTVRLPLLQDITPKEVKDEGVVPLRPDHKGAGRTGRGLLIDAFAWEWDLINGKRKNGSYAWDKNPRVWAITYQRVEKS